MTPLLKRALRQYLTATCAASALALGAGAATAQEIIDNGTVLLGIQPEGNLNADVPGLASRGLTFLPTADLDATFDNGSGDALTPGCDCEGWGVADLGGTILGTATEDNTGGDRNLANAMIMATGTGTAAISGGDSATATVDVLNGGMTALNVSHAYAPSASLNLYQVDVTITNVSGAPVTQLVYRRAMDWDIPPTEFSEIVTIQGAAGATRVIAFSDNGFNDLDPNVPLTAISAPLSTDFVDDGPSDHGAAFDFDFGTIADGEAAEFTIFYGAAASEADALLALGAVNAEVYSLGQPSSTDGATLGTPNTFIFAFAGVGGTPLGTGLSHDLLAMIRDLSIGIARQHSTSLRMDGLEAGGGHRGAGYTPGRGETEVNLYGIDGLRAYFDVRYTDGDSDSHGANISYDFDGVSAKAGLDKAFDLGPEGFLSSALVGAAGHYSSRKGTSGSGTVDVRGFGGMIYGGVESNTGFYADGNAGYSRLNVDSNRTGLMASYGGETDADVYSAGVRVGYDFPARGANPAVKREFVVGPYASATYSNVDVDGFTENNNGLRVDGFDSDRLDAEIGVRGQYVKEVNGAAAFAKGSIGLRHDFLNDEESVGLTTAGNATGTQKIDESDENAIALGLGLGAVVNDALTFSIEYDGLFGEDTMEHGFLGRARIAF